MLIIERAALPCAVRCYQSAAPAVAEADEDDDDFMASLSDDEEDEDAGQAAQALIAKKNAEREAAKRAAKGGPTAKSSLILDIKPEGNNHTHTDRSRVTANPHIRQLALQCDITTCCVATKTPRRT